MIERLLTAYIIHGQGPTKQGLTYKYMIMPNITVESISTLWEHYALIGANVKTSIHRNSKDQPVYIHGVCDPIIEQASAASFDINFQNGSKIYYNCSSMTLSVCLEQPGGILFSENLDSFTIIGTHPTITEGTFVVNVN